ncbi:MAG: hypothetical protein K9W43_10445 [Candidatus Thorarchaeota archaeon]|nr:hypothetical protein [Candidatus Thorarchaeota archaeon]
MAQVTVHCEQCNKPVSIDVSEDEFGNSPDGILRIMFVHGDPLHAIVVYIDRQLRVRGIECPDSFKFDVPREVTLVSKDTVAASLSEQFGEPCYQALYSYDEVKEREKSSFILDKAVLKAVCESGTICISQIRRQVVGVERALGERINLQQIEDICERYVREGLVRRA